MKRIAMVVGCTLAVSACGGGSTTPTPPPPPPPPPSGTVDRVVVNPATVSIERGGQGALIARPLSATGEEVSAPVVWSSANPAIVNVSGNGTITAVAVGGPVVITALAGGKTGTSDVTVTLPEGVETVILTPSTLILERGGQAALIATAVDFAGDTVALPVTWASSNSTIATVSAAGVVVGLAVGGPVLITATIAGRSATAQATVIPSSVGSVRITPDTLRLRRDSTRTFSVQVLDRQGEVLTDRVVGWRSLNPIVAQVSSTGSVFGLNFGITKIIATAEGLSDTAIVVIEPPPELTALVFVRNRLAYTVEILLDGNSRAQLPANGTLQLAVPNDRPARLGWALISPVDIGVTLGELVSDTFPTLQAPTGGEEFEVTATLSDGRRYFDPVLSNTVTSTVIDFPVRFTAVQCPCVAPSGSPLPTRGLGLWLLTPSSTLVLYRRTDFTKTGPSIAVPVPSLDVNPVTGEWVYTITQYP